MELQAAAERGNRLLMPLAMAMVLMMIVVVVVVMMAVVVVVLIVGGCWCIKQCSYLPCEVLPLGR